MTRPRLVLSPSVLALQTPEVRALLARSPACTERRHAPVTSGSGAPMRIEIPGLALCLSLNSRMHWSAKAREVKRQRTVVCLALAGHSPPPLPCVVTITRVGPRAVNDDNAAGMCKATRDEVAEWLGTTDEDPRVTWTVAQAKGPYAVRIEVMARADVLDPPLRAAA